MLIVVADKDPEILSLVSTRLEARDYEVRAFSETDAMMRFLSRESPDLILIATDQERADGLHVIDRIRRSPHLAMTSVIMMTDEHHVADLILGQERGFDDFLIKPFNAFVLQLRVALNIKRTRDHAEANALTHLPGNHAIERDLLARIEREEKYSVIYIDINNFKSFNDRYGFDKGDDVIRHTARIMLQVAERLGPEARPFVGHVGGDDFVTIIQQEFEESYARQFIEEFDRIISTYYSEADQKRGYVRVVNRRGKRDSFPLMSCSVAACTNLHREYKSLGEVAHDAAEVKSFLKSQPGSHYLRDRRSEPIEHVKEAFDMLAPEIDKREKKAPNASDPLGQMLLDAGLITEEQLSAALKRHFETGQRLGQVLIAMEAVPSEAVGKMLEKRLRIPYVSLRKFRPPRGILRSFTTEFIKAHRVVPLEKSGKKFKVGMCDPFDLRTLDRIEQHTGLKPVPCLTLEDEFEDFIDHRLETLFPEQKTG